MTTRNDALAKALLETLISPNEADSNLEPANVVDGLFAIARSLNRIADALWGLGNGNAATHMGAIEAFGLHIGEKLDGLTSVISELGESRS
jgi:hypothetical protein